MSKKFNVADSLWYKGVTTTFSSSCETTNCGIQLLLILQ